MKKIAIVRRNGLGDLLCSIPMISLYKKLYPAAELTLFLDRSNAALAPYLKEIDHFVVFPKGNRYFSVIKTALKYRKEHFDLAVLARPSPMKLINVFMFFLGAKKRVSAVDSLKDLPFGINCGVDKNVLTGPHQALRLLQLVDLTYKSVPVSFYPKISLSRNRREGTTVLISLTNNRKTSQISVDKYLHALNHFKDLNVIISCLPHDMKSAEVLKSKLSCKSEIFCSSSFDEFLHLINDVDFLFIGDGGVMHLAAALDKPQVVLFGFTQKEWWGPLSDKAICLWDKEDVNAIPDADVILSLEKCLQQVVQ